MYVYVCVCMCMHVYVCICMYMYPRYTVKQYIPVISHWKLNWSLARFVSSFSPFVTLGKAILQCIQKFLAACPSCRSKILRLFGNLVNPMINPSFGDGLCAPIHGHIGDGLQLGLPSIGY